MVLYCLIIFTTQTKAGPSSNLAELVLTAKPDDNRFIVQGVYKNLPAKPCLTTGETYNPQDSDPRYYRTQRYLGSDETLNSQTITYEKTTENEFKFIITKVAKDQTENSQWVLDAKLPLIYDCETGIKTPFTVNIVSDYQYNKAATNQDGQLFIVFTNNMKKKNIALDINNEIEIIYHSDSTLELEKTIKGTFDFLNRYVKQNKLKKIIETNSPILNRNSEYVLFNTSASETTKVLQQNIFNLPDWNIVYLLVDHWLINESPELAKQSPLRLAIIDSLTNFILQTLDNKYNLFKAGSDGEHFFEMNYDEVTNLLLSIYERNKSITQPSKKNNAIDKTLHQSLQLSVGLRSLHNEVGGRNLADAIAKTVTQMPKNAQVDFDFFTSQLVLNLKKNEAKYDNILKYWNNAEVLPDLLLSEVESTKTSLANQYMTIFRVDHNYINGVSVPIKVESADKIGHTKITLQKSGAIYRLFTEEKIKGVYINQGNKLYETNKFNNSNSLFPVKYFPGNAKSLYDDQFVVLWLPQFAKNPGELFTFGIRGTALKYVWSRLDFSIKANTNLELDSFSLSYMSNEIFDYTTMQILLSQDNRQLLTGSGSVIGKGLWGIHEPSELRISLINYFGKYADIFALGLEYRFLLSDRYHSHSSSMGIESGFGYFDKYLLDYNFKYLHPHWGGTKLRVFTGGLFSIAGDQQQEQNILSDHGIDVFRQLEGGIRVGYTKTEPVESLTSVSADLKMPLALFGGGLGLLGNKIFAKIFGDYGIDSELERYYATGLGVDLPFGSDMVGGSTVILSQLTLLVGLAQGAGDFSSTKPYILFTFDGSL